MNRWENLHLIVYWNGPGTRTVSVYSNGCKVDSMCGVDKADVAEYLHSLHRQGWEKFGRERPAGDLRETFYFQRPMDDWTRPLPGPQVTRPEPQFVHHRV